MGGSLKLFFKQSTLYLIFSLISKAAPFVVLPIIVRMVTPEDYGIYSLFNTIEGILLPIVSLNVSIAISRFYYRKQTNFPSTISSSYIIIIICMLTGISVGLILPNEITSLIGLSKLNLILSILVAGLASMVTNLTTIYRLQKKVYQFGLISVLQSVLLMLLLLCFVWIVPTSQSLINAKVCCMLLFAIIAILILTKKKQIIKAIDKAEIYKIISYTCPTVIFSFSTFIFSSVDKIIINRYIGSRELGIYTAIYQLTSLIAIVSASFNAAWMPWLFEQLKDNSETNKVKVLRFIIGIGLVVFMVSLIFIIIFPYIARFILVSEYFEDLNIATPLIIGQVFQFLYFLISPFVFYGNKTKYNVPIGICVALASFILNLFLIPSLGLMGAAISVMVSWIILFLMFCIASQKAYPMPWLKLIK